MLEKAERELARLREELNIDHVFNFFVTAYHVVDYVRAQRKAPKEAIDALYKEEDFRMARYICNKGKHLELRQDLSYATQVQPGSALGEFTLGQTRLGLPRDYLIVGEKTALSVTELAQRIIDRWYEFFAEHELHED